MSTDLTLVVLAAGLGSRFGGLKQLAPVGPRGATPLDYAAAEALDAGFGRLVLVVSSANREAIEAHVRDAWPAGVEVAWVVQDAGGRAKPLGTAHAVLSARAVLDGAFAVANADDVYGRVAYRSLADHLGGDGGHALVAYALRGTIVGDRPVNRALCRVEDGRLAAVDEGSVAPQPDGTYVWEATAGGRSERLAGDEPVSMNLWGFEVAILEDLEAAVDAFVGSGGAASGDECRVPDVVRYVVQRGPTVTALRSPEACLGVTHPEDLPAVQAALASRPPPWP